MFRARGENDLGRGVCAFADSSRRRTTPALLSAARGWGGRVQLQGSPSALGNAQRASEEVSAEWPERGRGTAHIQISSVVRRGQGKPVTAD